MWKNILSIIALFVFPLIGFAAPIKAFIFDCDGVIVDSEGLKFQAWQEAFKAYGVELHETEYMAVCGHTSRYILQSLCETKKIVVPPSFIQEKEEIYRNLQKHNVRPILPAVALLHKLERLKKKHGFQIGLASSASRKQIEVNLKALGICNIFDVIVSGKDDLKEYKDPEGTNKPKPYIYQKAAALLGVDPQECIIFEDTEAGVDSGYFAACHVIAIPNAFTKEHNFQHAEKVVESLSELDIEKMRNFPCH